MPLTVSPIARSKRTDRERIPSVFCLRMRWFPLAQKVTCEVVQTPKSCNHPLTVGSPMHPDLGIRLTSQADDGRSVIRRRRARGDRMEEDFENALSPLASRGVQRRDWFCSGIQPSRL